MVCNICNNKKMCNECAKKLRENQVKNALNEYKLENIKPSLCKSFIKYGVPTLENIINLFKNEQNNKEKRLCKLINKLEKEGKDYDENIPSLEKYIKEGGDIKKIIEESNLERLLIYNTKYLHYLKHNDIQTARYLATIEFVNSGKQNDIINNFISKKNTLKFF
jgi:hypothetical protein